MKKFLNILQEEMINFWKTINEDDIATATEIILNSEKEGGRVHITGIGKPSYVAGYIASLFSSTGTSSYVLHGTEAVHGSSGQVRQGDVVIAISNSGETAELKATVQTLIKNGAKIISCTRNKNSWLARNSEVCLLANVENEGGPLNKAPRASILAEISILQSLSVKLQEEKELSLQDYVKFHPGGSLGEMCRDELKQ